MTIFPREGILSPVASFMSVDLPQPEGPTMAMNSPLPNLQVNGFNRKLFFGKKLLVVGQPHIRKINKEGLGCGLRGHI